jgi:2-dehydro-3-deoxyphosphogluconate aldolase/(4S)-4-hydroxy-2-oxoglutarate aldolase
VTPRGEARDPLARLARTRLLFIMRGLASERAVDVALALDAAGFSHLEITSDSPGMPGVLGEIRTRAPELALGAGTVFDLPTALRAIAEGASFIVSPHTDPMLVEGIAHAGAAAVPGAGTATDVALAIRAGAAAVKLFPASIVTPAGLRDLRGPFPAVRFIPTGGASLGEDEIGAWLASGAFAVGVSRRVLLGPDDAAADPGAVAATLARLTALRDAAAA